ncbi:MAG: hypothetical protein PHU85_20615, partial [Phycisphaerae bacterium]|nr:hypothetical protein [Phycisphaerae bacterium]
MRPMLLAGQAMLAKAADVRKLVLEKIGRPQADEVGKLAETMRMSSPLRFAADERGQVVWSRVKIAEADQKATVMIGVSPQPVTLRQSDSQWRVMSGAVDMMPKGEVDRQMKIATESIAKMTAGLAAFEKKLAAGEVAPA